jgi:hypothetical protein
VQGAACGIIAEMGAAFAPRYAHIPKKHRDLSLFSRLSRESGKPEPMRSARQGQGILDARFRGQGEK